MKIKILLISVLCIFLYQGCSDEFFYTPPTVSESTAGFYSNPENIELAAIGCYSQLNAVRVTDLNYFAGMGSIASDDAEAGGDGTPSDTPDLQDLDRLQHTSVSITTIRNIWAYFFKGVYFCNYALANFPQAAADNPDLVPENFDIRIAEIKYLRALYYFLLCRAYGELPIFTAPPSLSEYNSVTRSDIKAVFTQIEKDLSEAIPVLPLRSQATDPGRATKGAAQALMANMLLYESSYAENYPGDVRFGAVEQRYDEALTYAEAVLAQVPSEYRLVGIDGDKYDTYWGPQTGGYRFIFTLEGDNSEESVFEIQNIEDSPGGWIQARGNAMTQFTTARRYVNTAGAPQQIGWGFNNPTQELLDTYEEGDPRIATSIARPGDSILVQDNVTAVVMWRPIDFGLSPTGYYNRKYEASPEQYFAVTSDWADGPVNVKVMRIAEVYLIAAEAAFKAGQTDKALEYVNMIRTRARMSGPEGNTIPADLTSLTFEDIQDERRRELACEGQRFFDLVRWRIAEENLNNVSIGYGFTVHYSSPRNDFYPIPQTELDVVPTLKQNEGW